MKLSSEKYNDVAVIGIQGELTADDLDALRRLIDEQLEANVQDFLFNLAEMDFIDSQGLELLLDLQETAGEKLGQVRLVQPLEPVQTILHMTRLDHHFSIHPDVSEAMRSLR